MFWIEQLTINIQEGEKLARALQSCGLKSDEEDKHSLVWGHVAYGYYDADPIETLQVGPQDPFYGGQGPDRFVPTGVVRRDTNLHKRLINYLKGEMNG